MTTKTFLYLGLLLNTFISFSQSHKFGKITAEEIKESLYQKDSTINAAYLYRECKTSFEYNRKTYEFDLIIHVHEKIKIYNEKGLEYATQKIDYFTPNNGIRNEQIINLKAFTYNLEDGNIKKTELNKKHIKTNKIASYAVTKILHMPNAIAGSIVELRYTLVSPFWKLRTYEFQKNIPTKQLLYSTEIPEYIVYHEKKIGPYQLTPILNSETKSISSIDKFKVYGSATTTVSTFDAANYKSEIKTYSKKNITATPSNTTGLNSGISYTLYSSEFPGSPKQYYNKNNETICTELFESDNFGKQLQYKEYFKNDLKKALKNKPNDNEKVTTILNLVKSKIAWNGTLSKHTNKGVVKAYQDGLGNSAEINLILVAMLQEAGLNANPVLVAARDNGSPTFAGEEHINYVIAAVKNNTDSIVLLDATEPYSAPNNLPIRALNWEGKLISENGECSTVSTHPNILSETNNSIQLTINNDKEVEGILQRKLTGLRALTYRSTHNKSDEKTRIKNIEKRYPIKVDKFREINAEDPTQPLSQIIQFESKDIIHTQKNKIHISPLLFYAIEENPFRKKNLKTPIDYGTPWLEKNQISITIPKGYEVESIPSSFGLGLPDNLGIFTFTIKLEQNTILINSEEKIHQAVIPTDYYEDLQLFYSDIISKQKEKIVLSKI